MDVRKLKVVKVDAITRPCKGCGRNIRWGTKGGENNAALTQRNWMPRCWDCAAKNRKAS
jgi:hypothetical protein